MRAFLWVFVTNDRRISPNRFPPLLVVPAQLRLLRLRVSHTDAGGVLTPFKRFGGIVVYTAATLHFTTALPSRKTLLIHTTRDEETLSYKTKDYKEALRLVRITAVEVDKKFEEHRKWLQS